MSRKMSLLAAAVIVCVVMLNGCSPSAQMTIKMAPNQTVSYESTSKMIKDYKFEQPQLKKVDANQTATEVTVKYDQTIAAVGADGVATAKIVIKGVQCKMVTKNELRYEFNSADAKYKSDNLNGIVGQSYTISINPQGKVKVLDAAAGRAVAVSGEGQNIAKKIFMDESIIERHQLPLPETGKALSAKQSWNEVVPSPPGLLAPKTFEKTYTVSEVGKGKVVVDMAAKESIAKAATNQAAAASSMGIFAKMFDNQDNYTGKLVMNTDGTVDMYQEILVSSYTAQEMPQNAPADALPDTLLMRLTYEISLKKLN